MKKNDKNLNHDVKIKLINTWFKIAIVSAVTAVILYRVVIGTFDFSNFDFSDLLSLILAIFSIWLSIMFYIKAEETSNTFYDNTYKFTKDVSIILGRIESGFGERLKHIDESYVRIESRYFNDNSIDRSQSLEKHEEEVREAEEEKQEITKLINQSKLANEEKRVLLEKLNVTQSRLSEVMSQLEKLREMQNDFGLQEATIEERAMNHFIRQVVPNSELINHMIPASEFAHEFQKVARREPRAWIRDLKFVGLVEDDLTPTTKGLILLRRAIEDNCNFK